MGFIPCTTDSQHPWNLWWSRSSITRLRVLLAKTPLCNACVFCMSACLPVIALLAMTPLERSMFHTLQGFCNDFVCVHARVRGCLCVGLCVCGCLCVCVSLCCKDALTLTVLLLIPLIKWRRSSSKEVVVGGGKCRGNIFSSWVAGNMGLCSEAWCLDNVEGCVCVCVYYDSLQRSW